MLGAKFPGIPLPFRLVRGFSVGNLKQLELEMKAAGILDLGTDLRNPDFTKIVARAYEAFQKKDNNLEWHIYLRALEHTNEVLFYRLLLDHIEELTPATGVPLGGREERFESGQRIL